MIGAIDGVTVEMIKQQINTTKTIEKVTAIYHKYPECYQQLISDFMQKKIQLQEDKNKPSINYNPNFIRCGSNATTAFKANLIYPSRVKQDI